MAIPFWRDVAAILLIVELMILVLPFFFLFFFALKGILGLNRFMRGFLPGVHGSFLSLQRGTDRAARVVITPVIAFHSYRAFGSGLIQGTIAVVKGRSG